MNINDELLMAYVDGEVDDATREQIERVMVADSTLRTKVEQHRALRAHLSAAFDPVLAEPIPDRLTSFVTSAKPSSVTDLSQVRAVRDERKTRFYQQPSAWMSLAASVVFGIAIGFLVFNERDPAMLVAHADGLIASGELEHALTDKVAADSSAAGVHIGISYIAKSGEYCRSFLVTEGAFAGFACRDEDAWRIRMLAPSHAPSGEFRTASSAMPESVLTAISDDMNGDAFDADEEAEAREKGWVQ